MGGEVLSAGKSKEQQKEDVSLPDLKEMFSLGPGNPAAGFPPRVFPERPSEFESSWATYYEEMNRLAHRLLSAFAIALDQPEDFFLQFTDHHASVWGTYCTRAYCIDYVCMQFIFYIHISSHFI